MVSFSALDGFGVCLSGDDKPEKNIENGDMLLELDTGTIFFYDEDNGRWLLWPGGR